MEAERRQRAASMDMADPAAPAKVDTDEVEDLADPANSDSITYKSRFEQLSVWQTLITFRKAVGYTLIVATALMMEGFEVAVTSSLIVNAGFRLQFGTIVNGIPTLDPAWVSAWGAITNVGQMASMTFVAFVANRYGRKAALYLAWALLVLSLVITTVARSPPVWLVGRFFTGMGLGIMQVTVVPYKIEIVPSRIRGIVAIFGTIWTSIGSLLCNIMLQQTNKRYPTNWLLPIYVAWGPMAAVIFCLLVVPESPWFYVRHGNRSAALKVMKRLYSGVPGYNEDEEYQIIFETIQHEKHELELQSGGAWRDFLSGNNLRRTLTVLMVAVAAVFGGQTLVQSYQTYFFYTAGLSDPLLATVIQTVVGLVAIICFAFITDKLGRRLPACIAYTLMSLSLWLIGALYYAPKGGSDTALVVLACVWIAAFTLLGNTAYLFQAELPSAHLRVKTGSVVFVAQAILNLACNFIIPFLLKAANTRAAFLFGGTSMPICLGLWLFLPETRARSPAEITELFESKVPAYRWNRYVTAVQRTSRPGGHDHGLQVL